MGNPRVQYANLKFILCAIALLALAGITRANPPAANAPKPEPRPVRVAVLDFVQTNDQAPRTEQNDCALSGKTNLADDWRTVIPMLLQDRVDVVVVNVNCWDDQLAFPKFHEVLQREFKPRFRTVAWLRACEAACPLTLLPIEEYYFYPDGALGNASTFDCRGIGTMRDPPIEFLLQTGEDASKLGHRDPLIFRAMLIATPLSADIDASTANVTLREDEAGAIVLNRDGRKLRIGAADALELRISRGTAATKEELARAMGLDRVEWVGQRAAAYISGRRDNRNPTVNQIRDEYFRLMGQIIMAKAAPTPREVRQHADAATDIATNLDALAAAHGDLFERVVTRYELDKLRATANRLRKWPTLRAAFNAAKHRQVE